MNAIRRTLQLLGFLVGVGALGAPAVAEAGKGKGKGKATAGMEIQQVGVKAFDTFFADARDIDDRLDRAQKARRQGRIGINTALGLERSTSLDTAVAELKKQARGNLTVVMRGGVPQLAAKEMLPSNLVTAVDAVNSATTGYATAIKDIAGVPRKTASMVRKSKRLPKKLKSHYVDNFNPADVPKMLQQGLAIKNNVKVVKSLPLSLIHI